MLRDFPIIQCDNAMAKVKHFAYGGRVTLSIVSEFRGGFKKAERQSLKSNKVSELYMATDCEKKTNVEHM